MIQVYRAKNDHNYEDTNVTRSIFFPDGYSMHLPNLWTWHTLELMGEPQ